MDGLTDRPTDLHSPWMDETCTGVTALKKPGDEKRLYVCLTPKVRGCSFGSVITFSNFNQLDWTRQTLCCISKSNVMKHQQKLDENSTLLWFSYDHRRDMFVDSLLAEYIDPPNYVHGWECGVVNKDMVWRVFMVFRSFDPSHLTTHQSIKYKTGVRLRWITR